MENRFGVMRDFLKEMKENMSRVVIITKNGYQMGGRIVDADDSALLFNV